MSLKLMYITNNQAVAEIADRSGVDWVVVDLEIIGKQQRQGHLNTVISHHTLDDVYKIKKALKQAKLLVRINPINPATDHEIDTAIDYGADIVMLPYFNTAKDAEHFIKIVRSRAQTCLLVETPEAVDNLDSILTIPGIDYIHIGLNDLHLGYKMKFMFELLADGTVEKLCRKIREKGIAYGFGGIAQLHHGTLPAEYIIAEHFRLGSQMVILSRSFCDIDAITDQRELSNVFITGIQAIREYETHLQSMHTSYFTDNLGKLKQKVAQIVSQEQTAQTS